MHLTNVFPNCSLFICKYILNDNSFSLLKKSMDLLEKQLEPNYQ